MAAETSAQADPERLALQAKEEGNSFYKAGKYRDAIEAYSRAIGHFPAAPYFNNRAAAYIMLLKFNDALKDAQEAISREPQTVKYHLRAARAYAGLGRFSDAKRAVEQALALDPNSSAAQQEMSNMTKIDMYLQQAEDAAQNKLYNNCISLMERALELAPQAAQLKLKQAEYMRLAGRSGEAERLASNVLREDGMHAEALYVRGLCLIDRGELEQALAHFKRALQSNPDHQRARISLKSVKGIVNAKERGTEAFKAGRLEEALGCYQEALSMDDSDNVFTAKLHFNCAVVLSKMDRVPEAIDCCTRALECDDQYIKALLKRGELRLKNEQFEEAVEDYQAAVEAEPGNNEYRSSLRHAKLELKKSKRKDYYKLLSVAKDASDSDIKRAYKKAALRCHPDRVPPEEKDQAEAKFKEIGEAYAILSDPQKKHRYDNGEDLDEINGHGHGPGGGVDVNAMFAQMFAG
ncbi:uncharacterized protein MONBRDRAFT_28007 [Monosiga brevicollis MX1]|uniref:J domain-containing protein n=1 Tax=Monosiga brevicollis TaxID=81824 RepID=A9V6X8_MONBE|nr:uncharacterized protein MONBRDRAFT_28007 [Monosiga brevicollis MX1]EDQ86694.1 predicted protein [Monosiga brevicollis MX1]|eukprot:XP_001748530.1 hypothetical protein [Monosiga brevicollis MX1]